MTSDPKNKGALFSQTLKVEDYKVHLFFYLEVNLMRYCDFEILPIFPFLERINKQDQRSTAPPLVSVSQLVHQSTNRSANQPIGY